ncbi:conserved hypothetical protein [Bradyrhizobium sp. ORS 278]|uniref:hypothetical protein n=1 Tax=Bradyrhizobium sp. (strain ORS 278) TaxID=114615 RepID=UPI000150800F|nr:hypothetical protein [Bradyrhizobium sp. ORS 278]CAL77436.1 conserved hypothetical protein [Bradyrhizobium sp. ORS 278]
MRICLLCGNVGFVCEAHPDRPWIDGPAGCRCGAPGDPCPLCNRALIETDRPVIDTADIDDATEALAEIASRHLRRLH